MNNKPNPTAASISKLRAKVTGGCARLRRLFKARLQREQRLCERALRVLAMPTGPRCNRALAALTKALPR